MHSLQNRNALRRALHELPLTEAERALINVVLEQGRGDTWTLMHGPKLGRKLSALMRVHEQSAYRALRNLEARGLVQRGTDEHHRPTISLTQRLYDGAHVRLQRNRIEALVGDRDWGLLGGNDEIADAIHEAAEEMINGRFRDRVKTVARNMLRLKMAESGKDVRGPDYGGHRARNVVELLNTPENVERMADRTVEQLGSRAASVRSRGVSVRSRGATPKVASTRARKAAQ